MIKVFQISVDGVGTDSFYEAHTREAALKEYKKDCIEEYGELDMSRVEAILYDEYYED